MTEIKLTLADPARGCADLLAAAEACGHSSVASHLREMAAQIEEQVKPAIEEPTEFGSMVKATTNLGCTVGQPGLFWVKIGGSWTDDGAGVARQWGDLDVIEVLRVGVGETPGDAWSRGYEEGVDSNRPSPVDRSAIHSALVEAADDATTAVMQALS